MLPSLFGRKQEVNLKLCRQTKDQLQRLVANTDQKRQQQLEEDAAKGLAQMKVTLQGTQDADANAEAQYNLITHLLKEDILPILSRNIHRLAFESRKDAQVIFSSVIRFKTPSDENPMALNYIAEQRPDLIRSLCHGYDHRESAMQCGAIIREALRLDAVAALIFYDEPTPEGNGIQLRNIDPNTPTSGNGVFWKFFDWIDRSPFEVSADAFSTFRELFTKQKKLASHYLQANMSLFVERYNTTLIRSQSYVTKRQSLQLLSTLLLERANYTLMTRYIESADNLKLIMLQLRDDRRMVNYEAFHVFKIFIANPTKSVAVQRILINNRDKLLRFLPGFLTDRHDDMQFSEEKAYLIKMIEGLPAQPVAPNGTGQARVNPGQGVVTA